MKSYHTKGATPEEETVRQFARDLADMVSDKINAKEYGKEVSRVMVYPRQATLEYVILILEERV